MFFWSLEAGSNPPGPLNDRMNAPFTKSDVMPMKGRVCYDPTMYSFPVKSGGQPPLVWGVDAWKNVGPIQSTMRKRINKQTNFLLYMYRLAVVPGAARDDSCSYTFLLLLCQHNRMMSRRTYQSSIYRHSFITLPRIATLIDALVMPSFDLSSVEQIHVRSRLLLRILPNVHPYISSTLFVPESYSDSR